ncbi:MAG: HesA/MoeB/ThiF family protein [Candidatus Sumerlaeota bacterium]|nr:HesA/MoeB/ThiF family protein [Candidatus Sumerlaeota bacterium]
MRWRLKSAEELPPLAEAQRERYARQIMQAELGELGQRRLAAATALVSRHGGLGGPAALSLAMAGIGKLILVHPGRLVQPALNRMNLMSEAGLGQGHSTQAAETLKRCRADLVVEPHDCAVNDLENLNEIVAGCDVVVSAAPTFEERRCLHQACLRTRTPMVEAAMSGYSALLFTILPGETACLQCAFPDDGGWEEPFPVLGAVAHALGAMAALEAVHLLTDAPQLAGTLLLWDAKKMTMTRVALRRDPQCPACGGLD